MSKTIENLNRALGITKIEYLVYSSLVFYLTYVCWCIIESHVCPWPVPICSIFNCEALVSQTVHRTSVISHPYVITLICKLEWHRFASIIRFWRFCTIIRHPACSVHLESVLNKNGLLCWCKFTFLFGTCNVEQRKNIVVVCCHFKSLPSVFVFIQFIGPSWIFCFIFSWLSLSELAHS